MKVLRWLGEIYEVSCTNLDKRGEKKKPQKQNPNKLAVSCIVSLDT